MAFFMKLTVGFYTYTDCLYLKVIDLDFKL